MLKYAKENDIICIDFRSELLKQNNYNDLICLDGIHPNEKGYELMSQIWIEKLSALSLNK
jgi:lysophospholipase L1-like esterase